MDSKDGDAFVSVEGPRGEMWEHVLGTRTVPVTSPDPTMADLTEAGRGVEPCYFLRLDALSASQRMALIRYVAERFEQDRDSVAAEIIEKGVPIPAEGCRVTLYKPVSW